MRKNLKFIIVLATVLTIVCSLFSFEAFAASAVIGFSKNTVDVGDSVTVSVSVKGNNMTGADLNITYNQDVLTYVSGADNGGAGVLKIVDMTLEEATSKSYSITFKAAKAGSAQISVSGAVSDGIPATDVSVGASATLNVVNKVLSSNANLKSLRLGAGQLSPSFSPDVTTYNVLIPNSATKCLVYATTADANATLEVEGSSTMQVGANKRVVIVTAPDGTQKSYTLNITRSDQPDADTSSTTSLDSSTSSLGTSLDGAQYNIATDISSVKLFNGFKASTALYNGIDVAVSTDSEGIYKIYYLKSPDSEELIPCILDNENNTFVRLKYVTQGENTYIFEDFPEDKLVPDDYYTVTAKIFDYNLKCYADSNTKLADFYYVYCFSNDRFGVYRYDSRENTLQRFPELVLADAGDSDTSDSGNDIISRFMSLKANAKIMVVCLIVAIIIAIALIVLLIIKLFNRNNDIGFDDDLEDDFESVSFDDDYLIDVEEQENEDN